MYPTKELNAMNSFMPIFLAYAPGSGPAFRRSVSGVHAKKQIQHGSDSLAAAVIGRPDRYEKTLFDSGDRTGRVTLGG